MTSRISLILFGVHQYRLVVDRVDAAALEYGTVDDVRSLTNNDMDDEDEVESDNCDMVSTASDQLAYHFDIRMLEVSANPIQDVNHRLIRDEKGRRMYVVPKDDWARIEEERIIEWNESAEPDAKRRRSKEA